MVAFLSVSFTCVIWGLFPCTLDLRLRGGGYVSHRDSQYPACERVADPGQRLASFGRARGADRKLGFGPWIAGCLGVNRRWGVTVLCFDPDGVASEEEDIGKLKAKVRSFVELMLILAVSKGWVMTLFTCDFTLSCLALRPLVGCSDLFQLLSRALFPFPAST